MPTCEGVLQILKIATCTNQHKIRQAKCFKSNELLGSHRCVTIRNSITVLSCSFTCTEYGGVNLL